MRGDQERKIIDMVGRLAESVRDFHERFGLVGPSSEAELLSRIPIQDEEVRELHEAVLSESPERVAEEATDVLFVAIGTMLRLDPELAAQALRQVIEKNDAKTKETHHINRAGKVVRKTLH